ncbi:nuclear transport factor 2 family protein [Nocardia aurantiaca]|uniref:Nuclear transport factor 2 family protein n=1 Tax=Nocardia aurantiaca TaxID=2675850 RepID=A0A6I3L045_9NOCA|nr:nuclear transport factor 2 family protein [Nocardia aurantiaca]MTE14065.1 nuclear transport factor 2 family protein [Nocardia aurantiaca]
MIEERLAALEDRLRRLEDELAITRLIASYGPLVDAGAAEAVAELWTEDGEYDVEGWHMRDRGQVRDMVESTAHQSLIAAGSAHFLGPASVTVDGDTAEAVCESLLIRHKDGGFFVWRAGANRFHMVRTRGGWRIAQRVTRALDGSEAARKLLFAPRTIGKPHAQG